MPSQARMGWIWPKDPRPGNPNHWPRRWRIFDVLTNKGPDIYVGRIKSRGNVGPSKEPKPGPTEGKWSRWSYEEEGAEPEYLPFPWARRDPRERYDYRTRTYQIPDRGTWSGVEYCNGAEFEGDRRSRKEEVHCIPRLFRDRNGRVYPAEMWHDSLYGWHTD